MALGESHLKSPLITLNMKTLIPPDVVASVRVSEGSVHWIFVHDHPHEFLGYPIGSYQSQNHPIVFTLQNDR